MEKKVKAVLEVIFQKRVRGFHQVSKREKYLKLRGRRPSGRYCFRAFGNLMKPEAQVFEITSPRFED